MTTTPSWQRQVWWHSIPLSAYVMAVVLAGGGKKFSYSSCRFPIAVPWFSLRLPFSSSPLRQVAEVPQAPLMTFSSCCRGKYDGTENFGSTAGAFDCRVWRRPGREVPDSDCQALEGGSTAKRQKVKTQTFWGSFRECLLVAVAVLGLVLLWPVCLVWVSSSLLLAFFPFLFQKKGRRPRNRPTFLQGLGILLFGTDLRTGTFSGIPLLSGTSDPCTRSLGSAGHFVECIVMVQVVGSRRSPGATILGRVQVPLLPTIVCFSRRLVPNPRDGFSFRVVLGLRFALPEALRRRF